MPTSSDTSCPVRPRQGEDDKGRDHLVLGQADFLSPILDGVDRRPSAADTQGESMRQIPAPK